MSESPNHSTRVAIISAGVSFVLSCIFAAYVIGQRTGKVADLEKWRELIAPKIERMDSVGSLSFEHWKASHDKESAEWKTAHRREHDHYEVRLKELEKEVKQLQIEHDGH